MTGRERWLDGLLTGAIIGTTANCMDTCMFFFDRVAWPSDPAALPAARATLLVTYFGVAAPWAIVTSVCCGWWLWGIGPAAYEARPRLSSWLWARDAGTKQRSARSIASLIAGTGFMALSFGLIQSVLEHVRTPRLAVALILALQLLGALFIFVCVPSTQRTLSYLLTPLFRTRAQWLLTPGALLSVAVLGVLTVGGLLLQKTATLSALPWTFAASPIAGLLIGTLAWGRLGRRRTKRALLGFLYVAHVTAMMRPLLTDDVAELAFIRARAGLAATWLRVSSRLADFDGDGTSNVYGGKDCAPLNRRIGPLAEEVPNNGIDEDCSGRDLVLAEGQELRPGKARYPRPSNVAERPHIVLITTDGLSFDRTGIGGNRAPVTPNLDAWATRATVFPQAFSFAPATHASLPALLTGAYPSDVSTANFSSALPTPVLIDGTDTLATMLSRIGYRTVAVLPKPDYFGAAGWKNLSAGFQVVDFGAAGAAATREGNPQKVHAAPEMTAFAIEEIARATSPLFLWIHYFDHHVPYSPNIEWGGLAASASSPVERFDAEVQFADRYWGELFTAVERAWTPEQYLMLFTADHGEAFDANHGESRHNFSLHSAELHVPLVIQAAAGRGQTSAGLVSALDVVPTLANLMPLESKHRLPGESLVGAVFHSTALEKAYVTSAIFDVRLLRYQRPALQRIGLRTADWYLVQEFDQGRQWLARWRDDPLERTDLSFEQLDQVERLGYTLRQETRRLNE